MEIKQSETKVIKRSQIHMNAYNPKNHSEAQVSQQKKNIRKVGILGGITWNELSSNLLDGHRRIAALDELYKYDPENPETDYDVKVEAVQFDDKTEKEQMTYMAVGNTKPDYNLIARYINDIDPSQVGISEEDVEQIKLLADDIEAIGQVAEMGNMDDDFLSPTIPEQRPVVQAPVLELPTQEKSTEEIVKEHAEKPKMTKEEVKEQKEHQNNVAANRQEQQDLYAFVTFANLDEKRIFCELLGVEQKNSMQVSGQQILSLIE